MQLAKVPLPTAEYELDGHPPHVVLDVAPTAVEYVPTPQSVHKLVPVDVLYLPATQFVHAPPSGPEEPALQMQFVEAPLASNE